MKTSAVIKNKTVSTRVSSDINERARHNLNKQGLTMSEYIRLSLIKAANNEVQILNFLDSPEALKAKNEAEHGETIKVGSINDFEDMVDKL